MMTRERFRSVQALRTKLETLISVLRDKQADAGEIARREAQLDQCRMILAKATPYHVAELPDPLTNAPRNSLLANDARSAIPDLMQPRSGAPLIERLVDEDIAGGLLCQ